MGLWDRLTSHAKAQFLDVIQWLDDTNDTVVWRFPIFNQAITSNSKVVVREGQAAVFVAEGKLSDVFGPGTYTLDTPNAPILGFFQSIAYGLEMPYKGDVLFVSTRQFTDNGWGTANPFMLRDAEFGPVRVRAFGVYSFRVTDPALFIRNVVGTDGLFTTDEITGQLKKKLVSGLANAIGQARIPVLDLAANYMELAENIRGQLSPGIEQSYGVTITDFTISNISLPPEVEKALDTRTKMGVLGNLDAYTKLQAADAIQTAAANPGLGGAGMGMGVGFGMGNMMGQQMTAGMNAGGQFNPQVGMQPPPPPASQAFHYSGPGGQAQLSMADVVARIKADPSGNHQLWAAGWPGWKSWKDVPEVAGQVPPPAAAPPPLPTAARFHYHGPAGQAEKSVAEVVAALKTDPDGAHMVWKEGFAAWTPAKEVPEIAAALSAGPPPPPAPPGPPGPPPIG